MKESQLVEFKEVWRDEYLKWVCGFANAEGGLLVIGRNDQGEAVGVSHAARLLEDLPNKIRDVLGIMADVRLLEEKGREIIEIHVSPYPGPISYKGEFHYRSGSTRQELKGAALEHFLLRKQGRHWDGIPIPYVTRNDLDESAFKRFRQEAVRSGRMDKSILNDNPQRILENLNLIEGGYLRRAAVLLFHEHPERFIPGAYVKIGFFRNHADLAYQDEIQGNLFEQARKTLDMLLTKYMKAYIHYEGFTRIDRFLFPREALRELILNAVVHRDYGSGIPTQIRVYENRLQIANSAVFPEAWTLDELLEKHVSRPNNPLIAGAFFRTGDIESWGRGIEKVRTECEQNHTAFPEFRVDSSTVTVLFRGEIPAAKVLAEIPGVAVSLSVKEPEMSVETACVTVKPVDALTETVIALLRERPETTLKELALRIGKSTRTVERLSARLVREGRVQYVGPKKGGHWEVAIETLKKEYGMSAKTPFMSAKASVKKMEMSVETRNGVTDVVIALLRERPEMTLKDLALRIGKSTRTVERLSARLVREGRVQYVGSKKSGHWEVLELTASL